MCADGYGDCDDLTNFYGVMVVVMMVMVFSTVLNMAAWFALPMLITTKLLDGLICHTTL